MPYVGSYIWKMRQKIGHDRMIMPAVDVVIERDDGEVLMVFNKDFGSWTFPGGYVEFGMSWSECAIGEVTEEAGVVADKKDLVPIGCVSGKNCIAEYESGDSNQVFGMMFVLKKWIDETGKLDTEEISEKRYFSIGEIEMLDLDSWTKRGLETYKRYSETGVFQVVEVD